MNNFLFSRFTQLVKLYFAENWKRIGIFYLSVLVILFIILGLILIDPENFNGSDYIDLQLIIYAIGLAFTGMIASNSAFNFIHKKNAGTFYIMLPASKLEKFYSKLLIHVILPFLLFTVVFYIAFIIYTPIFSSFLHTAIHTSNKLHPEYLNKFINPKLVNIFAPQLGTEYTSHIYFQFVSIYYLVWSSLFFTGSILFKRFQILQTIALIGVYLAIFIMFLWILIDSHRGDTMEYQLFAFRKMSELNQGRQIVYIYMCESIQILLAPLVSSILLFFTSYYKLKSKEL